MAGVAEPRYFESAAHWRRWLEDNHARETSLLVGLHKVKSGRPSMSWSESVDEALCYGWIDGVRRSLGEGAYTIRFSVRKKASIWSRINIDKAEALIASGRMQAAGMAKYKARNPDRSRIYSYEQRSAELDPAAARTFRANRKAWAFFEKQMPSYRKRVAWWLSSAKKAETRQARLEKVIALSLKKKCL